jgi:hypothetical protein
MNLTPWRAALLGAALSLSLGCASDDASSSGNPFASLTDPFFQGRIDERTAKWQKKIDALRPKYEARVERFEGEIAQAKRVTAASLEGDDLAASFKALGQLYRLTHPCGEEDCGTYPCGDQCDSYWREQEGLDPLNHNEAMLEREGIDDERAFIASATDDLYAALGGYAEAGRFAEADALLNVYSPTIPLPSVNRERYDALHASIRRGWIDDLVARAEAAREAHPGATILYARKGAQLAERNGLSEEAAALRADAAALHRALVAEYTFDVATGAITGPYADEVMKAALSRSLKGYVKTRAPAARADAVLTLTMGRPSFSRSKGSATGSFRYLDRMEDITNPKWKSAQRDCTSANERLESEQESCARFGSESINCSLLPGKREDAQRACARVSDYPQTIQRKVYEEYSYPITLHHLDTTLVVEARVASKGAWPSVERGASRARLTDEEHGAHSMKDGSVSSDPKRPYSEKAGYAEARSVAASDIAADIQRAFEAYRAELASPGERAVDDAHVHGLALYVILRPDHVPKARAERLVARSGVADAVDLLGGL